jgi:hypothetical protein
MERFGKVWKGLERFGRVWKGLEWVGFVSICFKRFNEIGKF